MPAVHRWSTVRKGCTVDAENAVIRKSNSGIRLSANTEGQTNGMEPPGLKQREEATAHEAQGTGPGTTGMRWVQNCGHHGKQTGNGRTQGSRPLWKERSSHG